MSKLNAALASIMLASGAATALAQPPAPPPHAQVIPAGANTTDPSAPFYIDLTGLDLSTTPPVRDPKNPHYPAATALPDGALPPAGATGNFIIGPSHPIAPESIERADIAKGHVVTFTMTSADSVIYKPGIAREEARFNGSVGKAPTAPGDPSNLMLTTSREATWTRSVGVYIPAGYQPGRAAPFMVVGDGEYRAGGKLIPVVDNLIAAHKIPPIVILFVGSGGQDGQGSERGREFDAVSGAYAQWLETEVVPLAEQKAGVRLTRDPSGRLMFGGSSAGSAAITAAWFRPDLYRRVLVYSATLVNQQWPHDPALPGGAWEYHSPWTGPARPGLAANGFLGLTTTTGSTGSPLVLTSPRKPIRIWMEVGDHDLFGIMPMADGMHDWVLANENMARVLAAKQYQYQFVFARDAGHVDGPTMAQTLPAALEWVWAGYPGPVQ